MKREMERNMRRRGRKEGRGGGGREEFSEEKGAECRKWKIERGKERRKVGDEKRD